MNKKFKIGLVAAAFVLGGALFVGASNNETKEEPGPKELLTMQNVKHIVGDQYEGVIESITLETNRSGSFYDIELQTKTEEIELKMDAYTGHFVYVEKDDRMSDFAKVDLTETISKTVVEKKKNEDIIVNDDQNHQITNQIPTNKETIEQETISQSGNQTTVKEETVRKQPSNIKTNTKVETNKPDSKEVGKKVAKKEESKSTSETKTSSPSTKKPVTKSKDRDDDDDDDDEDDDD